MPVNIVKTKADEEHWARAKAAAAKQGQPKNYRLIMHIFQQMSKAEGERGGHVIGHTQSGKPVYASQWDHPEHASFTRQDHLDAAAHYNRTAAASSGNERWNAETNARGARAKAEVMTPAGRKKWGASVRQARRDEAPAMRAEVRKAEVLRGGRGDDRPDSAFDPEQLRAGVKEEMEHTDDPAEAKEIAKDHLTMDKRYYIKLKRMVEKAAPELPAKEAGEYRSRMSHGVGAPALPRGPASGQGGPPRAPAAAPKGISKPPPARKPEVEKAIMNPILKSVLEGRQTPRQVLSGLSAEEQTRLLRELRKARQIGLFGESAEMRGVRGPKAQQTEMFGGGLFGGGGGEGSRGGHVIGHYPDGSPRYAGASASKPYGKHPETGTEGPPQTHGEGWEPTPGSKEGGWRRRGEKIGDGPSGPVHHYDHWFPGGKEKQPSLFGKAGEPTADELRKKYLGEWTPSGIKPGSGAAPGGFKPGESKPIGEAASRKMGMPSATGQAHPKAPAAPPPTPSDAGQRPKPALGKGGPPAGTFGDIEAKVRRGGSAADPSAVAAKIYRQKYGQATLTRRSAAARNKTKKATPEPIPVAKSLAAAVLRGEETLAKAFARLEPLAQLGFLRELRKAKGEQLGLFGGGSMGTPVSGDPDPGVGTAGGNKPPQGYQAVPGSKHGGFRKRQGAGYVYWYPGTGHSSSPHPADMPSEAAERHEEAAGKYRAEAQTAREAGKPSFSADSKAVAHAQAARLNREGSPGSAAASAAAGGIPGAPPVHSAEFSAAMAAKRQKHADKAKEHLAAAAQFGRGNPRGEAHWEAHSANSVARDFPHNDEAVARAEHLSAAADHQDKADYHDNAAPFTTDQGYFAGDEHKKAAEKHALAAKTGDGEHRYQADAASREAERASVDAEHSYKLADHAAKGQAHLKAHEFHKRLAEHNRREASRLRRKNPSSAKAKKHLERQLQHEEAATKHLQASAHHWDARDKLNTWAHPKTRGQWEGQAKGAEEFSGAAHKRSEEAYDESSKLGLSASDLAGTYGEDVERTSKLERSMQPGASKPPGKDPLMKTKDRPTIGDKPTPEEQKKTKGKAPQKGEEELQEPQPGDADYHKEQAMKHLAAAQAHANAHHSAKKIAETGDHDEKVKAAEEASGAAIKKGAMHVDLTAEDDVLRFLDGGGQVGGSFDVQPDPRGVQRLAALRGGVMVKAEKPERYTPTDGDTPGGGVAGGTVYQGEWSGPRGGDAREQTMRLKEQLMTVEDDPAGNRGQGGLDPWFQDAYGDAQGIETDVNVPVGPASMVRKAEEPPIQIIDDDDPYTKALYRADPRDGAAGLRMAYQGEGRDRNRRG